MKKLVLKKLKELPDAQHPNNIDEGFEVTGFMTSEPIVGEPFWVGLRWRTSPVTEILSENTFKTYNSIYQWTLLESNV